jgi:DNA-binding beta-propeller fold protein YncE
MTTAPLRLTGHVELPDHKGKGGFDHAAVHAATGHVYVAHTANDAVDVFDPASGRHLHSITDLPGVAGAFVSDVDQVVLTTNRAADTIGVFAPLAAPGRDPVVRRLGVGVRPNGLTYDPGRRLALAANVGDPQVAGSHTLSMVTLDGSSGRREIPVAGRTRWAIFDPGAQLFYVNIMDPAEIVVVDPRRPDRVARKFEVPHAGPHGLDLDPQTRRLFCACDAGVLVTLDARSGAVLGEAPLSGVPDVVFFNPARRQLYVAVGDPGVIDVFSTATPTATMTKLATIETEPGAHTTALAPATAPGGDRLYAFLPKTHRAAIYEIAG